MSQECGAGVNLIFYYWWSNAVGGLQVMCLRVWRNMETLLS